MATARSLTAELARRGLRPDCVLTGQSDQRSRIALLGLLSCGGWRGGFTQTPGLYHRPLSRGSDLSLIDNNLRLAGLVGCEETHREPRVYFSAEDVDRMRVMSEAVRREAGEGRPLLVLVTQNSGGQRTGWHPERFVEVIRYAAMSLGFAIAYVGTGAEAGAIEALRAQAGQFGQLGCGVYVGDVAGGAAGAERLCDLARYRDDACGASGGGADGGAWPFVAEALGVASAGASAGTDLPGRGSRGHPGGLSFG